MSVLGGFAQGFTQARQAAEANKQREEDRKLRKKLIDAQIAASKTSQLSNELKLKEMGLRQTFLEAYMNKNFPGWNGEKTQDLIPATSEDISNLTNQGRFSSQTLEAIAPGMDINKPYPQEASKAPLALGPLNIPTQTRPGAVQGPAMAQPNFAASFGPQQPQAQQGGGLSDYISRAIVSDMLGIPIDKAVSDYTRDKHYKELERQADERISNWNRQFAREGKEVEWQTIIRGGNTYYLPINKWTHKPVPGVDPILKERKKALTADAAGKLQMAQDGRLDIQKFREYILPEGPDGPVDYVGVFNAWMGTPWTKGRESKPLLLNAMEAKVRIESGAAVPDQEVRRMGQRFSPSVFDTPDAIKDKMLRLERFLAGTVEKLDPNTRYPVGTEFFEGTDKVTGETVKYAVVPGDPANYKPPPAMGDMTGYGKIWPNGLTEGATGTYNAEGPNKGRKTIVKNGKWVFADE